MITKNIKTYSENIKSINGMALPLILNSVAGLLIGLIDKAMVGRISLEAFGAVGLVSGTINSIAGVLGMLAIAFNISGARSKGAYNKKDLDNKFFTGIVISSVIGLLFWIMTLLFGSPILICFFGIKGEFLKESLSYLNIFSLSVGLNMILFMFSSYFKIINKTKNIFYGNLTATICDVILNYMFIFGKFGLPKMGVKGAAIASILALLINLCVYLFKVRDILKFEFKDLDVLKHIKEFIKISLPLMGQEFLEDTIFVICISAILTRIGVLEFSIYNLLKDLVSIILMPMYAYSATSLTMVSEKIGSNNNEKIRGIPKICLFMTFVFCTLIAVVFITFKDYIPKIITANINLIRASSTYILVALGSNIFNLVSTIYKYSLQGISDEKWVFLSSSIINMIGIGFMFLLSIGFGFNLYGIYLAVFINYLTLSGVFYIRYDNRVNKLKCDILLMSRN